MSSKVAISDIYPLTSMQKGILFHCLKEPDNNLYIEQFSFKIKGNIDRLRFERSWQKVIDRHDMLHSVVRWEKLESPVLVVKEKTDVTIEWKASESGIQSIDDMLSEDARRGIDFTNETLRISVCIYSKEEMYMVVTSHHIFIDGWSSATIVKNFVDTYNGQSPERNTVTYKEYLKYSSSIDHRPSVDYWAQEMSGFESEARLPFRADIQGRGSKHYKYSIGTELTNRIKQFISTNELTAASFFYAAWGLILRLYNREPSFGVTLSGRNNPGLDMSQLVGLFINTVPLRINAPMHWSILEYLHYMKNKQLNVMDHSSVPLPMIKSCANVSTELFNTVFVVENYPVIQSLNETDGIDVEFVDVYENTHYDLIIQLSMKDSYELKFLAKEGGASENQFVELMDMYISVMEQMLERKKARLDEVNIKQYLYLRKPAIQKDIVVCSTFTSEPIQSHLEGWLRDFDWDPVFNFTAYDSLFGELTDHNSATRNNKGVNIFLIRMQDLIRNVRGTEQQVKVLKERTSLLIEAFSQYRSEAVSFVDILTEDDSVYRFDKQVVDTIHEAHQQLTDCLRALRNFHLLDSNALSSHYQFSEKYNPILDQESHIPYTEEYNAVLGTTVARQLLSWNRHGFKLLVLDCDNTLWNGVCGEVGWEGVEVNETFQRFQHFLRNKKNEGFLLALCSKNNDEDVWAVFENNSGMILQRNDFVAYRINWDSKVDNIKEIAAEVNILLSSIVFIDDSITECLAVIESIPEVLTIHSAKEDVFDSLQSHIWAFDMFQVTSEDRKRTEMYLNEAKRSEVRAVATYSDYLNNLNIVVTLSPLEEQIVQRVAQLSYRTNQFTLNSFRRDEQALSHMLTQSNVKTWVISCHDRFGEYGITGLMVGEIVDRTLVIRTFFLSCRILGKHIEFAILKRILQFCNENGILSITADYMATGKNEPIYQFLLLTGWKKEDDKLILSTDCNAALLAEKSAYIECSMRDSGGEFFEEQSTINSQNIQNIIERPQGTSNHLALEPVYIQSAKECLKHAAYLKPLLYSDTLLNLYRTDSNSHYDAMAATYISPETKTEETLLSVWRNLLNKQKISVVDNFFNIGGDSIKATMLVSRIHKLLHVKITIADVFKYSSIRELATFIKQKTADQFISIPKAARADIHPVSPSQRRIYIMQHYNPGSVLYNIPFALVLRGELKLDQFRNALHSVLARHEILRTSFEIISDEPIQKVMENVELQLEIIQNKDSGSLQQIIDERNKPFDLSVPPLFRAAIVQTGINEHILCFIAHHIILDAQSIKIFMQDLSSAYNGEELDNDASRIHYKDFSHWYGDFLSSGYMMKQKSYWLNKFNGELPALQLPTDHSRPGIQSHMGDTVTLEINPEIVSLFREFAIDQNVTPYIVALSIYIIFLHKHTGQKDIIVGSPITSRQHYDLERTIGMFANTIPLRNYVDDQLSFLEFMGGVKESTLEAYDNKDYPFDSLINDLQIVRDPGIHPLVSSLFVLQDNQLNDILFNNLLVEPVEINSKVSLFDLSMELISYDGQMKVKMTYNIDVYNRKSVEHMAERFAEVMEQIVMKPNDLICQFSLLNDKQTAAHIALSQGLKKDYECKTIIQLFEEQVDKTPDLTCLLYHDARMTYEDINKKANKLAWRLKRSSVNADDVICVIAASPVEIAIAVIGILKSGACYLPLSPQYPKERIVAACAECKPKVILAGQGVDVSYMEDYEVISLNAKEIAEQPEKNLHSAIGMNDLAYVIYTSGTTGKPKCVMIEHKGVSNSIQWRKEHYKLDSEDTVVQLFNYVFDGFVTSFFTPIVSGARVVVMDDAEVRDVEKIAKVIGDYHVTQFICVPTFYSALLDCMKPVHASFLKQVTLAGENVTSELVSRSKDRFPWIVLNNEYGPTENSVVSTIKPDLQKGGTVTVGNAITNTSLYILDEHLDIVPNGLLGEIYLGGAGLARGYMNASSSDKPAFIKSPFMHGEVLYKTGDMAKRDLNGEILIYERIDDQVKINGYRIDLSEIDACVRMNPYITSNKTVVEKKGERMYLVCYYVSTYKALDGESLAQGLANKLPNYMIPSIYRQVEELPLLESGKIDIKKIGQMKQLTIIASTDHTNVSEELKSIIEQVLAMYHEVLRISNAHARDNFFELGGNSLYALLLLKKLQSKFQGVLGIADLFTYPSAEKLSKYILSQKRVNTVPRHGVRFEQRFVSSMNKSDFEYDNAQLKVEIALVGQVSIYAHTLGVTLHDVIIAAFTIVLSKMTMDETHGFYLFDKDSGELSVLQIAQEGELSIDTYIQKLSLQVIDAMGSSLTYAIDSAQIEDSDKDNDLIVISLRKGFSQLPAHFNQHSLTYYFSFYDNEDGHVGIRYKKSRFSSKLINSVLSNCLSLIRTIVSGKR